MITHELRTGGMKYFSKRKKDKKVSETEIEPFIINDQSSESKTPIENTKIDKYEPKSMFEKITYHKYFKILLY